MLDSIEQVILEERALNEYPGFAMVTSAGRIAVPMLLLTDDDEPVLYMVTRVVTMSPSGDLVSDKRINARVDPPIKLGVVFFDPEKDAYYDSVLESVLGGSPRSDLMIVLSSIAPDSYVNLMEKLVKG